MASKTCKTAEPGQEYNCNWCHGFVGIAGLIGNALIAVLKIFVGILFFSTAILADALYSVLDVGFSILIIIGLRISEKPADETHEYGHGKLEFVITILFAVLTVTFAIGIFFFAVYELHEGSTGVFSWYVLLVAGISVLANLLFYNYAECVADKFNSPSIHSLAIHSKADALSSVLVAVSMMCAYWGYHKVDSMVAIFETGHILYIGVAIFKTSLDGLLDAAISPEEINKIKKVLASIPDIKAIRFVRSRKAGQRVWVNISVEITPTISISKVDSIKNEINTILEERIDNLENIMVNTFPYRGDMGLPVLSESRSAVAEA